MPIPEKHIPGVLNTDLQLRHMKEEMYRYLLNGVVVSSDGDDLGALENALGTRLRDNPVIDDTTDTIIKAIKYEEENAIIAFVYSSVGDHKIMKYTEDTYDVLLEWSGLNFEEDKKITGFDILNGNLIFTDDSNEIRKLLLKNLGGTPEQNYPSTLLEEDITLLRRAPRYPLAISKTEDETVPQNLLERNSFQFTYRYIYWDNEKSKFAPMSRMAYIDSRDTLQSTNNNNVIVSIPDSEDIRDTVKAIEWVFRVDNTNEFALYNITEPEIRQTSFRNAVAGATVPDAEVIAPYDDIPHRCRGLRGVQNRLFINDYTSGRDYEPTSLKATIKTETPGSYTNQNIYFRRIKEFDPLDPSDTAPTTTITYERYWWKDPNGNWWRVDKGADGIFYTSSTESFTDGDMAERSTTTGSNPTMITTYFYPTLDNSQTPGSVLLGSNKNTTGFKAGDPYQIAIRYTDHLGRHPGAFTNPQCRLTIPEHVDPFNIDATPSLIDWELTDDTLIPDWATHYEILRTRNLSRQFFLQGVGGVLVWGKRDEKADDSAALTLRSTWGADFNIYIHLLNSTKYKIGYVFSDGDRCKFFFSGQWYDSKIIGQDGPWIIVDNVVPSGNATQFDVFYEIYTPYLGAINGETVYEIGNKYDITDPGTPQKAHSVTTGTLTGDVHRKQRPIHSIDQDSYVLTPEDSRKIELEVNPTVINFEATNPNDDYYEQWVTDAGRPTVVVPEAREQFKKYTLKYGGSYDIDSLINYVSSWNPFDEYNMPLENGPAVCLASSNNNILYFHEGNASTIYINEGFTSTQDGTTALIRTVETVGDDRKLMGGHGTENPESIAEFRDRVWWWDVRKGTVNRYSNEGVVSLSDKGMLNYFYQLSRKLLPYKSSSKVYGMYDEYNDYYILTFAPISAAGYAGETFAFADGPKGVSPVGWYSFNPEMYGSINKKLASFKSGKFYIHDDSDNYNTFYGVKYDRIVKFVGNQDGSKVKIWGNFRIDAESIYDSLDSSDVVITITNDQDQEGRVYAHQIEDREGVFVGAFRQDVLTPNNTGQTFAGGQAEQERYFMYNGDVIRSQVCEVEIRNNRSDKSPLYFVTLLYRNSEASFS